MSGTRKRRSKFSDTWPSHRVGSVAVDQIDNWEQMATRPATAHYAALQARTQPGVGKSETHDEDESGLRVSPSITDTTRIDMLEVLRGHPMASHFSGFAPANDELVALAAESEELDIDVEETEPEWVRPPTTPIPVRRSQVAALGRPKAVPARRVLPPPPPAPAAVGRWVSGPAAVREDQTLPQPSSKPRLSIVDDDPLHLEASIAATTQDTFWEGLEGELGVFLATYTELPVGTEVVVTVYLPGAEFTAKATVAWTRRRLDGLWPGLGLALQPSQEIEALIRRFSRFRPSLFHA